MLEIQSAKLFFRLVLVPGEYRTLFHEIFPPDRYLVRVD